MATQIPRSALVQPNLATPSTNRPVRTPTHEYAWNRTAPGRAQHVNVIDENEIDVRSVITADSQRPTLQAGEIQQPELQGQEVNAVRPQATWTSRSAPPMLNRVQQRTAILCWQCE